MSNKGIGIPEGFKKSVRVVAVNKDDGDFENVRRNMSATAHGKDVYIS